MATRSALKTESIFFGFPLTDLFINIEAVLTSQGAVIYSVYEH